MPAIETKVLLDLSSVEEKIREVEDNFRKECLEMQRLFADFFTGCEISDLTAKNNELDSADKTRVSSYHFNVSNGDHRAEVIRYRKACIQFCLYLRNEKGEFRFAQCSKGPHHYEARSQEELDGALRKVHNYLITRVC